MRLNMLVTHATAHSCVQSPGSHDTRNLFPANYVLLCTVNWVGCFHWYAFDYFYRDTWHRGQYFPTPNCISWSGLKFVAISATSFIAMTASYDHSNPMEVYEYDAVQGVSKRRRDLVGDGCDVLVCDCTLLNSFKGRRVLVSQGEITEGCCCLQGDCLLVVKAEKK